MTDDNEQKGWTFDKLPEEENQSPDIPESDTTQSETTPTPPLPPTSSSQEESNFVPAFAQGASKEAPKNVNSIFDVAGSVSAVEVDPNKIPKEVLEEQKRIERQNQIRLAIKGTIAFAAIIGLIFLGMFVYRIVTKVNPGSDTPEAVITNTFSSLAEQDPLGTLRQLDPEETAPLLENDILFSSFLQQNEEIRNADQPLESLNFEFSNIATETVLYTEDIARVELTSGTIKTNIDGAKLPRNSSISASEINEINIEDANSQWAEGNFLNLTGADFEKDQLESEHIFYVAVKRDGRWYLSSLYTAAEYLRITGNANGWELGEASFDPSQRVGRGGDTPEQALSNMINAVISVDSQATTEVLSSNRFPVAYDYSNVFKKAEEFNENNLFVRAAREGVSLTNLETTVRNYNEEQDNGQRFVAISSLIFNIDYNLEVTTKDLENFGFVPFAARAIANWDGQCLKVSGAYSLFEITEKDNEEPLFPITDSNEVEFTSEELTQDPSLAEEIEFPVVDSQENVFESPEAFNGGTTTVYNPKTTEIEDRDCYRQNPSDFPEIGVVTVQQGARHYISPVDTLWHFMSWIITGNHTFDN